MRTRQPDCSGAPGPLGRVVVIGLGLIGGSLARVLQAGRRRTGIEMVGWDVEAATRTAARDAGLTVVDEIEDIESRGAADLVVLAVPLRAMARTAAVLARILRPGSTITDVGSVKAPVRAALQTAGLHQRYVGAHPMAGTEHSGFAASSRDLLVDAVWAVTTTDEPPSPEHMARVKALVAAAGGSPLVLSEQRHDEATALVSHVPHVLATALLGSLAEAPARDAALRLAAGSFRDGTRVARTGARRTEAMVEANAAQVAPVLRGLAAQLVELAEDLAAGRETRWFFDAPDPVRAELRDQAELQDQGGEP